MQLQLIYCTNLVKCYSKGLDYMKLYAKEKVFTLKDKFRFFNEADEDVYFVEGKLWSWTKKLTISDPVGNEVAQVNEKFWSWLPTFHVFVAGEQVATIKKKFTWFKPKYEIDCKGWTIEGDVWDHNYTIMDGENQVATVTKKWFSWGDSYEMDITAPEDSVLVTAIVLCIDCVQERNAAAASSSTSTASTTTTAT